MQIRTTLRTCQSFYSDPDPGLRISKPTDSNSEVESNPETNSYSRSLFNKSLVKLNKNFSQLLPKDAALDGGFNYFKTRDPDPDLSYFWPGPWIRINGSMN